MIVKNYSSNRIFREQSFEDEQVVSSRNIDDLTILRINIWRF